MKKVSIKIRTPVNATISCVPGDSTKELYMYSIDKFEVLEQVILEENVTIKVKDGQFVEKGDVLFTKGVLNTKTLNADCSGIIEIKDNYISILGHKQRSERIINFNGSVRKVIPGKFICLDAIAVNLPTVFYINKTIALSNQISYFTKKDAFHGINQSVSSKTVWIHDCVFVDDIAKLIALGINRLIVTGVHVDSLRNLQKEVAKLDSFAITDGFGISLEEKYKLLSYKSDILWGKKSLLTSEELITEDYVMYEHPNWGIPAKNICKSAMKAEFDYNNKHIESYLKNIAK